MTTLLIDADILAYRAVSATQNEVEFDDDEWTITCDLKETDKKFCDSIDELMDLSDCKDYLLCFSDPEKGNFRKQLNPDYKATRSQRKPVGYWPFIRKVHEKSAQRVKYKSRLEADDVIGILATMKPDQYHIWSIDKDLKQVPGIHYELEPLPQEVYIDPTEADLFFLTQVLTGDQVDNYPGCPGCGPVKAQKALARAAGVEEGWSAVLKTYITAGLTEDDALLQARMAFILRAGYYNCSSNKVKLWKPPTTS